MMPNKKIISTPKKYYILALIIMAVVLIIWIVFDILKMEINSNKIVDIAKNTFFAIMGSLLVSFLIDVGNTSIENKIQKASFEQLKGTMDSIYANISGVSFVLSNAFSINNEGEITLNNYYNHEFCFKSSNVQLVINLNDIANFKERINNFIEKVINSNSFLHLNEELRQAIEALYIERFFSISQLNDRIIESNFILMPLKDEISILNNSFEVLKKYLNKTDDFRFLSKEEADSYHDDRIKFQKEHKEELNEIYKLLNHTNWFKK